MTTELKSPPPDRAGMRARLDAALWRWLSGAVLTDTERRILDMHMRAGGCPSGGRR